MAEQFKVELCMQPAAPRWGKDALLSFHPEGANIHLSDDEQEQNRRIRRAARQLSQMGLASIQLVGEWQLEQQWALWQGLYKARKMPSIEWAEMEAAQTQRFQHMRQIVGWVRHTVNRSAEDIYPEQLAREAGEFITQFAPDAVNYRIIKGDELLEHQLVGIHAVGRGSERPPALLELDYCPAGEENNAPVAALVGKGITFDSGGYSLKPTQGMLYMKADMGGAATVTGALALAITQSLKKRVKLYLCCAENLVSGRAYKLGDILTYKNGTSVEIVNTDAEGRLVLADGLILAGESGAANIIDAATLTGAAHIAVGPHFNALFTMDDTAATTMLKVAQEQQDPLWRLPLLPIHQEECPSDYADTANSKPVPGGGAGGASNAAAFLSRFVPDPACGWLHLDLAACFMDKGTADWNAGATGLGVRSIATYLNQL